jgi:hypothetical protein
MKQIIKLLKKIFINEQNKPLGRWNIDYCINRINRKIDLSNEDHSGPYSKYIIEKINN